MIEFNKNIISTITLNAPERRNALNHDDFLALNTIFDEINANTSIRAVIIHGKGNNFCAGVDFASLKEGDWATKNPLNEVCDKLFNLRPITIAAIEGAFVGGGAEFALSTDLRIGCSSAKVKLPPAAIAVHYEPSGLARIAGKVGDQIVRRMLFGLESFSGDELKTLSFVTEIHDEPLIRAQEIANNICKLAPLAIEGMKISLNSLLTNQQDENARARIKECFSSDDFAESLEAISEKRSPIFTRK